MNQKKHVLIMVAVCSLFTVINFAAAQGTAFTYQGQLQNGASPANGSYDFTFSLFNNSSTNSSQVGSTLTNLDVGVTNGQFTTLLDFGANFPGASRWLAIGVRSNGLGGFTTLSPLQEVTPTPYSIYAANAGGAGSVAASNVTGTLGVGQLPSGVVTNNETGVALGGPLIVAGQIESTSGGYMFPDGSVQTSAAAGGVSSDASRNTAVGSLALDAVTINAYNNTADGYQALYSNEIGVENTAIGTYALLLNTNGSANTASGAYALELNTSGGNNAATGYQALRNNTKGTENTADGYWALYSNLTGNNNTANGAYALAYNTNGSDNTATGHGALYGNAGSNNTASGYGALFNDGPGSQNTADGALALADNQSGVNNTAIGYGALANNFTGSNNTVVGASALGNDATGSFNIAIGYSSGLYIQEGSNNIDIGNSVNSDDNNTIRLGNQNTHTAAFIAGIYGKTSASGAAVYVNSQGQLGTLTSSRKFKDQIQTMGHESEVLYSLNPVKFRYKRDIDPNGTPQFGLIAEEVDKVDPQLVVRDDQHGIYTVRYEAVNAMLLNEFLKDHKTVAEQNKEIENLKQSVADLKQLVQSLAARK